MPLTRLHFVVFGKVQGIGYRYFVRQTASALGLSGWVRNLDDGSVELEAQGSKETLETLEQKLRTGHPYARVDTIDKNPIAPKAAESFDIV